MSLNLLGKEEKMNRYPNNAWPTQEQKWLLDACLFSGSRSQDAWGKWKESIDLDKIDHASYQLLPFIAKKVDLEFPGDPTFEKCKGVYRSTWVKNQLAWKNFLKTLSSFLEAGIDKIIVAKGMAMILHYHNDFGVRVIGDIDILIHRKDISNACLLLNRSGWKVRGVTSRFNINDKKHLDFWHSITYIHSSGIILDLHWSFFQGIPLSINNAVIDASIGLSIDDISLYVPSAEDLLLQTCVHGIKPNPTPPIRWISDAFVILKNSEKQLDWDRFVYFAKTFHFSYSLGTALRYLSEEFQACIPSDVLKKLQTDPVSLLERLEYRCHSRQQNIAALWFRFCLNRGYFTLLDQMRHFLEYLKIAARLRSYWHMPVFAIYWIFKRIYRYCRQL